MADENNFLSRLVNAVHYIIDTPVTYVREKFVVPNQKKYPWYHQQFRRVPTIDECYTDDIICYVEANSQFFRDKLVDDEVVYILRCRFEQCAFYHGEDKHVCDELKNIYEEAATNWFIKYGDLGVFSTVKNAYMKQKHRMIWERRHGPVGSGMKSKATKAAKAL